MDAVANVLFGKTRQAVLGLLFVPPASAFYLREMARMTGISTGALQKELDQLVAAGLVSRERDGNRVTYRADETHPVFDELSGLVNKTCGVAALLEQALRPLSAKIEYAVLFGSFAKGSDQARSDIDLLVVGGVSLLELSKAVQVVEKRISREVNVRLYDLLEVRQRYRERDRFLTGVIEGPHVSLLGDFDGIADVA